jgi:hypothetical protein
MVWIINLNLSNIQGGGGMKYGNDFKRIDLITYDHKILYFFFYLIEFKSNNSNFELPINSIYNFSNLF